MLKTFVSNAIKNDFLRHNAIFFAGSLAVSVINYAYYPVLGRLLELESYGEVQVLVSLFLQLAIFLTVLSQVAVNIVANYEDAEQKNKLVFELEKFALMIACVLFVVGGLFAWQLRDLLHFSSVWPFIILLGSLIASVPVAFRSAYLRGQQKFGATSNANLIGAAGKLVASAALVIIGWGTAGAIGGLIVAQIIALAYAAHRARAAGFKRPEGSNYTSLPRLQTIWPELKFSIFVLVVSLAITILASIDIFIVKHYFDPATAGAYAGISTVAKIIFFLTGSVPQVMLSAVRIQQKPKENRQLLLKSAVMVSGLGGSALLAFSFMPHFIMGTLMGGNYLAYAHLLPALSLAMFVISLINLIVTYYTALRWQQVSGVVVAGTLLTIGLMVVSHGTLDAIVNNLLIGSVTMLGMCGLWHLYYQLINRRENG